MCLTAAEIGSRGWQEVHGEIDYIITSNGLTCHRLQGDGTAASLAIDKWVEEVRGSAGTRLASPVEYVSRESPPAVRQRGPGS